MAKTSLSGFPEWLPSQRLIEQHFLNVLQNIRQVMILKRQKILCYQVFGK